MDNNIKIAFTGWWKIPYKNLLERFKELTPNHSGEWKNIIGVDNYEDADIIVIFEKKRIKNKDNKPEVYLKSEPDALKMFDNFSSKYSGKPYIPGGIWWIEKPFNYLESLKYDDLNKSNILGTIIGIKRSTYGHKLRLNTITKFSEKYPDKIDIHGKNKPDDLSDKVFFKEHTGYANLINPEYRRVNKFRILKNYKYEIVIENSQQKDYWTEKISDSLLSYCMPIYWGCPNILDYFPKEALHLLDDSKDTTEQIYNIINTDIKRENIEAIEYSRQLILHEYNLWNIIYKILNNE